MQQPHEDANHHLYVPKKELHGNGSTVNSSLLERYEYKMKPCRSYRQGTLRCPQRNVVIYSAVYLPGLSAMQGLPSTVEQ